MVRGMGAGVCACAFEGWFGMWRQAVFALALMEPGEWLPSFEDTQKGGS